MQQHIFMLIYSILLHAEYFKHKYTDTKKTKQRKRNIQKENKTKLP